MAQDEPADPLDEIEERLRETREAARRLRDAHVPPQGWAAPPPEGGSPDDLAALVALLRALRDLVPPELQGQLTDATRQVLLLARAVIDRWLEVLEADEGDDGGSAPVEDIPIA